MKKYILVLLGSEILFFTIFFGPMVALSVNLLLLCSLGVSLFKALPMLTLRMKMRNVSLGKEIIRKNSSHPKQQDVIDVKDVKIDNINDTIEEELVYDELFR